MGGELNGLWDVPTKTVSSGIGMSVWNGLAALLVTIPVVTLTINTIRLGHRAWPQTRVLNYGLICLSLYLIVHWIDSIIHVSRTKVTYGYILISTFFSVLKIISDVLVLCGSLKLLFRLEHLSPRFGMVEYRGLNRLFLAFLFLSFYHICLLFARDIAWLYASDPQVIQLLATARNGFEIAYMAMQFLGAVIAFSWARDLDTVSISGYYQRYIREAPVSLLCLVARSFCEIVIVGQLDRWPAHLATIFRARDVTYSLFSIAFTLFISFRQPNSPKDSYIAKEEDEVQEVKLWVLQAIERKSESGRATAPELESTLQQLERELESKKVLQNGFLVPKDTQGLNYRSTEAQLLEIERIRMLYRAWTPVCKG
ncbi:hypothetical protein P152DRAFT_462739 [Eremomyces bilateralis CBS 781.70]|uniref:DUF300-domain-containing protein n=1 Tax=Eremomyces bilateralis CBS 781.70 TaxID=1392243 RepID=A0A6G1FRA7_9PEZI|nr:uncharacterized protein P152DRAFT_462739 [Eremomyces bilateralis CBS 781.70]KAF1808250.1 hypothetical protein P152DRAFT_462739 [Eremomyces bilateralis CBS 781.70]